MLFSLASGRSFMPLAMILPNAPEVIVKNYSVLGPAKFRRPLCHGKDGLLFLAHRQQRRRANGMDLRPRNPVFDYKRLHICACPQVQYFSQGIINTRRTLAELSIMTIL